MLNKTFSSWLTAGALLFLTGCWDVSVSLGFRNHFTNDEVQPIPFQEVSPSVASAISERRLVVIRDVSSWDALWREHTAGLSPTPPLPGINFSQNMVIGIFLGTHPTTCRGAAITSVTQHSNPNRIEVEFREIALLPESNCPSGTSNPATLVVLPYSSLPVEFFQT